MQYWAIVNNTTILLVASSLTCRVPATLLPDLGKMRPRKRHVSEKMMVVTYLDSRDLVPEHLKQIR